jgi:uroporphyrinogen-III synthase
MVEGCDSTNGRDAGWAESSKSVVMMSEVLHMNARGERSEPWSAESVDAALLNRIARRISAAAPLEGVLLDVVEFVTSVVKCDSCFVYLLEQDDLILRASKNPHPELVNRLKLKLGQGITGWVAEHCEPVMVVRNAAEDPRFKMFNDLPEDRYEAFLSVPLASGGRLLGVINVQNRAAYHYSPREVSLTATVGFMVGAEIERARLASENSELSARLESRKIVERAKGILQRELKITEEEAYRAMQRESQQRRKSMKEIAEAVLLLDNMKRRSE